VALIASKPERAATPELGPLVCVAGGALVAGAYAASAERGEGAV